MAEIHAFKDTEFISGGQVWVAQRDARGEIYKTFPTGRVAETNVFINPTDPETAVVEFDLERTIEG